MKVQKIVSLDVESVRLIDEYKIQNFSAFVRDCLRNGVEYLDLNNEILCRIRWKKTADLLANKILELEEQNGIEHTKTREQIVNDALQQTRLDDHL